MYINMLCGYMHLGFTCFSLFISLRPPSGQTSGDYSFIMKMTADFCFWICQITVFVFNVTLIAVVFCWLMCRNAPQCFNVLLTFYKAVFVSADACMIILSWAYFSLNLNKTSFLNDIWFFSHLIGEMCLSWPFLV